MKAEFLSENIQPFLSPLTKALPNNSPVPVLLNIMIEATPAGLFFSATDLELGVRAKVAAKVDEDGAVTVPGKQFVEIINSLPKGKISLEQERETLTISSAGGTIKLQIIPKEEFPNLFEEKGEKIYSFTASEVKSIFSKLVIATAIDDTRAELTGIYIVQKGERVDFVATDGYRLSLKKLTGKTILDDEAGIIISSKFVQEALSITADTMDLYMYAAGNQVILETENITLVGRLIQGNFPNYARVIPEHGATKVVIDGEEFSKSLKLASIFARESANIVRVKIEGGVIRLFSRSSGVGEGDIRLEVEQTGEDNEISFNVKFLNDLLRVIDEKRLVLEINGPLEAALFTLEKDKEFLHVIMPVRVQE